MNAQENDADVRGGNYISGNVGLSNRGGLSNLTVTATGTPPGSYTDTTDINGNYSINNVQAGTYTVSATYNGNTKSQNNVNVSNGRGATGINFTFD